MGRGARYCSKCVHANIVQCISLGELEADADEGWEKSCTFRGLWPGLCGGPVIPLKQKELQNREFIGTGTCIHLSSL